MDKCSWYLLMAELFIGLTSCIVCLIALAARLRKLFEWMDIDLLIEWLMIYWLINELIVWLDPCFDWVIRLICWSIDCLCELLLFDCWLYWLFGFGNWLSDPLVVSVIDWSSWMMILWVQDWLLSCLIDKWLIDRCDWVLGWYIHCFDWLQIDWLNLVVVWFIE